MNNFISYGIENIKSSIKYQTLSKGLILDEKLIKLLQHAEPIKFPKLESEFEKEFSSRCVKEFCKKLKFVLYDRMETSIHKNGKNLWIGSLEREYFEKLFFKLNGIRSLNVLKKGKKLTDYNVFIQYTFNNHKFLDEYHQNSQYFLFFL